MYDASIIIPTYKEEKTIETIIRDINEILQINSLNFNIIVVDDNSPDNTIKIVESLEKEYTNVSHIIRTSDKGLSQSVIDGINHTDSPIVIVTDADESHDISKIPLLYQEIIIGNDVVIGSRYLPGGGISNWTQKRKIISRGATFLARSIFPKITDPVSGFFAIKKDVIKDAPLKPKGYKILFEILGKGYWNNFKEIPYIFTDRTSGESKLKGSTIREYFIQWLDMLLFSFKHRNNKAWNEIFKMIKFMIVGCSGIFINTGTLFVLYELFHIQLILSSIIAVECSIINNYLINDFWTFKNQSSSSTKFKIMSFHGISLVGMFINILILYILTNYFGIYYIASNLIGIFIAFIWNFFANRSVTWN